MVPAKYIGRGGERDVIAMLEKSRAECRGDDAGANDAYFHGRTPEI
jgi:hypothetical protein